MHKPACCHTLSEIYGLAFHTGVDMESTARGQGLDGAEGAKAKITKGSRSKVPSCDA